MTFTQFKRRIRSEELQEYKFSHIQPIIKSQIFTTNLLEIEKVNIRLVQTISYHNNVCMVEGMY